MYIAEKAPYTLVIKEDNDPINPCDDHSFGTMVSFHRRYSLGDDHRYSNKDDFLRDLFLDTVGNTERGEQRYEKLMNSFDNPRAADNALLEVIAQKHVILPLYLYDHSVQSISTGSFIGRAQHAEWDSGQVGWIYATKDEVLQEFGGQNLTVDKRESAEQLLRGEVEQFDHYLRGECYGFELYKNDEMVDSCWGFWGDFETATKDIESNLPKECAGIADRLTEKSERTSVLSFLKEAGAKIAAAPVPDGTNNLSADAR